MQVAKLTPALIIRNYLQAVSEALNAYDKNPYINTFPRVTKAIKDAIACTPAYLQKGFDSEDWRKLIGDMERYRQACVAEQQHAELKAVVEDYAEKLLPLVIQQAQQSQMVSLVCANYRWMMECFLWLAKPGKALRYQVALVGLENRPEDKKALTASFCSMGVQAAVTLLPAYSKAMVGYIQEAYPLSSAISQTVLAWCDFWLGLMARYPARAETLFKDGWPYVRTYLNRVLSDYGSTPGHCAELLAPLQSHLSNLYRMSENNAKIFQDWINECHQKQLNEESLLFLEQIKQVAADNKPALSIEEGVKSVIVSVDDLPLAWGAWQTQVIQALSAPIASTALSSYAQCQQPLVERLQELMGALTLLLGPAPCAFCVLGLGSLARSALAPSSDIDIALLISDEALRQHPYFRTWVDLLDKSLALLGAPLAVVQGSDKKLILDASGWVIDRGDYCQLMREEQASDLIQTPEGLVQWITRLTQEASLAKNPEGARWAYALLMPMALYQSSSAEDLLGAYQEALQQQQWQGGERSRAFAQHLLKQHSQEFGRLDLSVKEALQGLHFWCIDLALYQGSDLLAGKTALPVLVKALVEKNILAASVAPLIERTYQTWQQMRQHSCLPADWAMQLNIQLLPFYAGLALPLPDTALSSVNPYEYLFIQAQATWPTLAVSENTVRRWAYYLMSSGHEAQEVQAAYQHLPSATQAAPRRWFYSTLAHYTRATPAGEQLVKRIGNLPNNSGQRFYVENRYSSWRAGLQRLCGQPYSGKNFPTHNLIQFPGQPPCALHPALLDKLWDAKKQQCCPSEVKHLRQDLHPVYTTLDSPDLPAVYIKLNPSWAGNEMLVASLGRRICGDGIYFSEIAKLYLGGQVYAALISEAVVCDSLHEYRHEPDKLAQLEPVRLSELLLHAMLVNPEDAKPEHYKLNREGQLISIDNEQAFVPPLAKKNSVGVPGSVRPEHEVGASAELLVKCFLFCLQQMRQPLAEKAVANFLSLDAQVLLLEWLTDLKHWQERVEALFSQDEQANVYDKGSLLQPKLRDGTLKVLLHKIDRMQRLLKQQPACAALDLLKLAEPTLGYFYGKAMKEAKAPYLSFKALTRQLYTLIQGREQSRMTSRELLRSVLLALPDKASALSPSCQSISVGIEELLAYKQLLLQCQLLPEEASQKVDDILKQLAQLWGEGARETVLQRLIDPQQGLSSWAVEQQKRLFQLLTGGAYERLPLKGAGALTDSVLEKFMTPLLAELDIRDCPQISDVGLGQLLDKAPYLQKILLKGQVKIKHCGSVATFFSKAQSLAFPQLRYLSLEDLPNLSNIVLKAPQLESLIIKRLPKLTVLKVEAPKLWELVVEACSGLVVENCELLAPEMLDKKTIRLLNCPGLMKNRWVGGTEPRTLFLSTVLHQAETQWPWPSVLPTVKELAQLVLDKIMTQSRPSEIVPWIALVVLMGANQQVWLQVKTKEEDTALTLAAAMGQRDIVRYLIETVKVDIEQQGFAQRTALLQAAAKGQLEVVEYLLSQKASVQVKGKDKDVHTALTLAAGFGNLLIVRYLIETVKVEIEQQGPEQCTTLLVAAVNGQLEVVEYLLSQKASVQAKNKDGDTALTLAAGFGNLPIVRYLIETAKVDIEQKGRYNRTALLCAAEEGKLDVIVYLLSQNASLEARDKNEDTALTLAAKRGCLDIVRYLIETAKVDIEQKGYNQRTALLCADGKGNLDMVIYLLSQNASLEARDKNEDTALTLAAERGRLDIVRYLVETVKVDIEQKGRYNRTALLCAAEEGKLDVIVYLLSQNASLEARDKNEDTALTLAAQRGRLDIVRYLVETVKVDIEQKGGYNQYTALLCAAAENNLDVIVYLLSQNASLEARDKYGCDAAVVASRFARFGHEHLEVVSYLLDNLQEADWPMALLWSSLLGHIDTVAAILQRCSNKNLQADLLSRAIFLGYLLEKRIADENAKDKPDKSFLVSCFIPQGFLLLCQGNVVQSEAIYKHAVSLQEKLIFSEELMCYQQWHFLLGQTPSSSGDISLWLLDDYEEWKFSQILRHDKSLEEFKGIIFWHRSWFYFQRGEWARAKELLTELALIPRRAALAHYYLGLVAKQQGLLAEAKQHFAKVLEQEPQHAQALLEQDDCANALSNEASQGKAKQVTLYGFFNEARKIAESVPVSDSPVAEQKKKEDKEDADDSQSPRSPSCTQ